MLQAEWVCVIPASAGQVHLQEFVSEGEQLWGIVKKEVVDGKEKDNTQIKDMLDSLTPAAVAGDHCSSTAGWEIHVLLLSESRQVYGHCFLGLCQWGRHRQCFNMSAWVMADEKFCPAQDWPVWRPISNHDGWPGGLSIVILQYCLWWQADGICLQGSHSSAAPPD